MKNVTAIAASITVAALIAIAIFFWLGTGYGRVSPDAYQVAQALYGCCLAKSEPRLEMVDALLNGDGDQKKIEITAKERQWFEAMVAEAKKGNWQTAAAAARQMMEDQVQH